MGLHKNLGPGEMHVPYEWAYDNATQREGASGFVSSDLGKLARQLDDDSLWLLTATTPTWIAVGGLVAHAASHESGGSDAIAHQNLSGAGTNAHSTIDTHLASTSNPHLVTKAQVGLDSVTNDAQLKRAAGDFALFPEKPSPSSLDVLLIEDAGESGAKKYVTLSALPAGFPVDFARGESEGESSTTSSTWQDKVSMGLVALTGTYRVAFCAETKLGIGTTNKRARVRLYNATDDVELCLSENRDANTTLIVGHSGHAYVVFAGAGKTLKLQWASFDNSALVSIRRARIEFWRVS